MAFLMACTSDENDNSELQPLTIPSEVVDDTTIPHMTKIIKIGNHTDVTGPASNAMQYITMALEDLVEYYNEQGIVPGIEFEGGGQTSGP